MVYANDSKSLLRVMRKISKIFFTKPMGQEEREREREREEGGI
jgi:hypothetical protein